MSRPDNQADDIRTTQQVQRLWRAWATGERNELNRILAEDPTFLRSPEALADLVYSEYWLRKQIDTSVTETEYLSRFPAISAQLSDQFAVAKELFRTELDQSETAQSEPSSHDTTVSLETTAGNYDSMVPSGFEPLGLLGVGGMGVVVKARQKSLDRDVAIKSLKAGIWVTIEDKSRLRQEAHIVGRLAHPNIVQMYDVIEEDGKLFLVMEFVPGRTLAQVIGNQPADHSFASMTIRTIVAAIEAAHRAGYIHRDIKPSNVLVSETGDVKVTDFGLARATDHTNRSLSGELLGTLAYMAPEQVIGKRSSIDNRTDIYGIGATLYELLTGRPPFIGSSAPETLMQVVHADVKPIRSINPSVPRDLESICYRCIEKAPEKRYETAKYLLEDIDRFLSGIPTHARPLRKKELLKRWIQRHPTQFVSLAVVSLALFAFLISTTWYVTRLSSLESISKAREDALSEAEKRAKLSLYFALVSGIQRKASEQKLGWTWDVQQETLAAQKLMPNSSERLALRDAFIQSLSSFDLRKSKVVLSNIDPYGLTWSPNGNWLAIGENVTRTLEDKSEAIVVYLLGEWPDRRPKEILILPIEPEKITHGMVEGVRSLVFLDDNRHLVVGCRSGWIQIVDVELGTVTQKWRAHENWCFAMAYDPKRKWLFTGSRDRSLKVWDIDSLESVHAFSLTSGVRQIALLEESMIVQSDNMQKFSLLDFREQPLDLPDKDNFSNLRALGNRKSVVFAGKNHGLNLDLEFNEAQELRFQRTPFTQSRVHYIDHSERHGCSALCGIDTIAIMDMVSNWQILSLPVPGAAAKYATFDPKGDCLWVTNNHELVKYDLQIPSMWTISQIAPMQTKRELFPNHFDVLTPAIEGSGIRLSSRFRIGGIGTADRKILAGNVPPDRTTLECIYDVLHLDYRPAKNTLPFFGDVMSIWDSTQHELLNAGIHSHDLLSPETAFCLSADGQIYWTADRTTIPMGDQVAGRLRAMRVRDASVLLEYHNVESEKQLRLSAFEQIICGKRWTFAISGDRKLRVYDSNSFQLKSVTDLDASLAPKRVAANDDESWAYVGTREGMIIAIELETQQLNVIGQSTSEISSIAVSKDGAVITGNQGGEIEVWSNDVSQPKKYCSLATMHNSISWLEFSGDGSKLAVQVQGELAARPLNWTEFYSKLAHLSLD